MKENIVKKEWKRPAQKKYYYKNPEKVKQWRKNYYKNNKEKILLYMKEWKAKQPPVIKPIKKCLWCSSILGEGKTKYCNDKCEYKYKMYCQRRGPIWFWRFYTKYEIYKWVYSYFPKYKRILIKKIPKFFKKFFLKNFKLFKKIKKYYEYRHLYFEKTKLCNHWVFYISKGNNMKRKTKNIKNFCSDKCKQIYENKIAEAKKQRNLAAWGMEHRPDEETRRIINNKKHAEWAKQKRINDPAYKLIKRMRLRTKKVLGVNYRRATGMTDVYTRLGVNNGQELKKHLESKWKPGMTWENYGSQDGWVIDHIIPLKYYKDNFDLANDIEIQKKAFGIQNLQPLWWLENAKKSAKLNYEPK